LSSRRTAAKCGAANSRRFLHNELGHRVYDPAEEIRKKKASPTKRPRIFREWKQTDIERFPARCAQDHPVRPRDHRKQSRLRHLLFNWGWRRGGLWRKLSAELNICVPPGHSRVPDDGCRRRASQRMDAGLCGPRFFFPMWTN